MEQAFSSPDGLHSSAYFKCDRRRRSRLYGASTHRPDNTSSTSSGKASLASSAA